MVIAEQVWHSENAALGWVFCVGFFVFPFFFFSFSFFLLFIRQCFLWYMQVCLKQRNNSSSRLCCPQYWSVGKTAVVQVAATLNKEACMAVPVQLQDLPKALFSSCHSFLWTFAFCCLVADGGWI